MNIKLLVLVLMAMTYSAFASESRRFENTEIHLFDARCEEEGQGRGKLLVDLKAENVSESLYIEGNFHTGPIALKLCLEAQEKSLQSLGSALFLKGILTETNRQVDQDVWGICRGSPRDGRETYPCKKGSRKIDIVDQKTEFDLFNVHIIQQ